MTRKTKKYIIEEYFKHSLLLASNKFLIEKFNISNSYLNKTLKDLRDVNKICKINGKIKYHKKNETILN